MLHVKLQGKILKKYIKNEFTEYLSKILNITLQKYLRYFSQYELSQFTWDFSSWFTCVLEYGFKFLHIFLMHSAY